MKNYNNVQVVGCKFKWHHVLKPTNYSKETESGHNERNRKAAQIPSSASDLDLLT